MATNEELEKKIEQLSKQVDSLQDGFNKFQELLLNIIKTKQLKVDENAQIAGHDIGQTLEAHNSTLSNHNTSISAAQATANDAVNKAKTAQNTADTAVNKADQAQGTADNASTLVQNLFLSTELTSDRDEDTRKDWWKAQNAAHRHCNLLGYRTGFMVGESPDGKIYPIVCLK